MSGHNQQKLRVISATKPRKTITEIQTGSFSIDLLHISMESEGFFDFYKRRLDQHYHLRTGTNRRKIDIHHF